MSSFANSSHATHSTLVRYILIGWFVPAVVVSVAAFIDFCEYIELTIGYGQFGSCWIGNRNALLVLFVAPVSLVLFLNVVFFITSVYRIRSSIVETKRYFVGQSHSWNGQQIYMVFKMSITFGFMWILGLLETFISSYVLSFIFAIASACQGPVMLASTASNTIKRKRNSTKNVQSNL
ncbi:adhesion G protein-coupled receptor L1-like [Saccoglossus kowalevskii]